MSVPIASANFSAILPSLITDYFQPKIAIRGTEWTSTPVPGYTPFRDDLELLDKALATESTAAKFGKKASFKDLWNRNVEVLADIYCPDDSDTGEYDESQADAALAQHLAFWTGCNCEHILNLMWCSKLARAKWTEKIHKTYLKNTITRAVSMQDMVYTAGGANTNSSIAKDNGGRKLSGTKKQADYAEGIREQKLTECGDNDELIKSLCVKHGPATQSGFWIDNKDLSVDELIKRIAPIELPKQQQINEPEIAEGYQFLPAAQQIEHFAGCVYVQSIHRIFTPNGSLLKPEQFNATYGGYVFQLDGEASGKTTKKAFEAFTESQIVRYQKAELMCFRPELQQGVIIKEAGRWFLNVYVPHEGKRIQGDVSIFLNHVKLLLPNEQDREIFLSYMAACVQRPGVKFQWCVLLQGAEGNGKTFFYYVLAYAMGERYAHLPNAADITNPFNAWIEQKLLIGIEEAHTAGRQEVADALKPLITNKRIEIHGKGQDQRTGDNRANFILFSNHKDAVLKSQNDRRYCVFYTAQQEPGDIERDGMNNDYFANLYKWSERGGYANIAEYLATRPISVDIMGRSPITSSTGEAISSSLGVAEQIIQEAIELHKLGFRGDLIETEAANELLRVNGKKLSPQKVAVVLSNLGYIKHPALSGSEGKKYIDGKRRRIYVKRGSLTAQLTAPEAVADAWRKSRVESCPTFGVVQE